MRLTAHSASRYLVAGMIALSVSAPRPSAGECIRIWKDTAHAKNLSELVFSGTVTDMKPGREGLDVTFAVDRAWKGRVQKRLTLALYMNLDSFRVTLQVKRTSCLPTAWEQGSIHGGWQRTMNPCSMCHSAAPRGVVSSPVS
jgi:hypothetical protein